MPIQCQICQKLFSSIITSTHLKKHEITSAQYKNKYGEDSLASDEYRENRSQQNSGENNPNYNNRWSLEQKRKISTANKGKTPWNKGVKTGPTGPKSIETRKKISGSLKGRKLSSTTRSKISESVLLYANQNQDEIKRRAQKANTTKTENGYYKNKKEKTIISDIEVFRSYNLIATHIGDRIYNINCNECKTQFTRGAGQWHARMCPGCSRENSTSKAELELYNTIKELLPTTEIYQSDKTQLYPFELDIYIPDLKLAFEYNGLYWHSESAGKSRWYHRKKLSECMKKDITLIQIFEDEWIHSKEKVVGRIKAKLGVSDKIYGRNCIIRSIDKKVAFEFLNKYHIQGRGQAVYCYGLYHNNELVAVMSFSKLNKAKGSTHTEGVYELNRYASVGTVIGGASKLFRQFIKDVLPNKIITYSDLRWNSGEMYEKLGFEKIGETTPGYWYVSGTKRIHRYKLRKQKDEPSDIPESELRKSQGYHKIWDCGHNKYVWQNKSGH